MQSVSSICCASSESFRRACDAYLEDVGLVWSASWRWRMWEQQLILDGDQGRGDAAVRDVDVSSASSSTPASTPTPAADPAVVKLVPASVKSKGTITVAADASYAPDEFIGSNGHTVVGMDADLSTRWRP